MDNNEFIVKLFHKEDELLKICMYHGISIEQSRDIIQDVYFKLLKFKNIDKYTVDNQPNMYIVFAIIRNVIYDYRKKEHKFSGVQIDEYMNLIPDEELKDEESQQESLYYLLEEWLRPKNKNKYILEKILKFDFIPSQINKISHWFDKTIVQLYILFHQCVNEPPHQIIVFPLLNNLQLILILHHFPVLM